MSNDQRAEELRKALDLFDSGRPYPRDRVADAARERLAQLEGDIKVLGRVTAIIVQIVSEAGEVRNDWTISMVAEKVMVWTDAVLSAVGDTR